MTNSHEAGKIRNPIAVLKDLGCHAIALALVNPSPLTTSGDSASILATVL